jgi:hypothetical protein
MITNIKKIPLQPNPKPVYVIMNNKRYMAYTDGKGNAYYNKGTNSTKDYEEPSFKSNNMIKKEKYEFDRFLSGMDF